MAKAAPRLHVQLSELRLREQPDSESGQTQRCQRGDAGMSDEQQHEGNDCRERRQKQEEEAADGEPLSIIPASGRTQLDDETSQVKGAEKHAQDPGCAFQKADRIVEINVDIHAISLFPE